MKVKCPCGSKIDVSEDVLFNDEYIQCYVCGGIFFNINFRK